MYVSLSQALDKLETQVHKHAGKQQASLKIGAKDMVPVEEAE